MHISLWHSPYNGGWIGFDQKKWRHFTSKGWRYFMAGWKRPTLYWSFLGFYGHITLQSWPFGKNPGDKYKKYTPPTA